MSNGRGVNKLRQVKLALDDLFDSDGLISERVLMDKLVEARDYAQSLIDALEDKFPPPAAGDDGDLLHSATQDVQRRNREYRRQS